MSETESYCMEEAIERIMSRKIKPIYWAVGIMVAIFISVAAPLTSVVISLSIDETQTKEMLKNKVSSEELYRNFLPKLFYHQLQKAEHISDINALNNPANSEFIWMKHNQEEAEKLEIRYRGGS